MDSELLEWVELGMQQRSVLSPFISTMVVDVVTEFSTDGVLSAWCLKESHMVLEGKPHGA